MSTFAVTDSSQVIDALNYALSNLGQGSGSLTGNVLTANLTTGVITTSTASNYISYLYRYVNIRYATAADGSTGFSTSPTNATYYGVQNTATASPSTLSNPASYQWTRVTGGFGTTKFLFYSTPGGQQIQFYIGTTQPSNSFAQTQDGVAIDLTFVTATSTLPIVVLTAFYSSNISNIAPATPTGGTYDFGNLIFTAPSTWGNSISSNSTAYYSSQNTFKAPTGTANLTVGPIGPWTTPVLTGQIGANGTNGSNGVSTFTYGVYYNANSAPTTPSGGYWNFGTSSGTPPTGWSNTPTPSGQTIYISTATVSSNIATANISVGNSWSTPAAYSGAGQQGQRGFIPMAYVLTPSTPIGNLANVALQSNLSTWFAASTNGTPPGSNTAPVGTGYAPVGGDTAAFTYSSNTSQVAVYTFNSGNLLWSNADGQVVNGNVFVTGSVNASKLNANDVYALNIIGGNAQVGNNRSGGFWMQASTGDAHMAGNVYIGNSANIGNLLTVGSNATIGGNLIIGNNAYIGGNLTVAGLISGNGSGAVLNANTVTTTTVVPQSLTSTDFTQTSLTMMDIVAPATSTVYYAGQVISTNCYSSGNTITSSDAFTGDFLNDYPVMLGQPISVISGTGSFAANTTVNSILTGNSFTTSSSPTVALSNATIQTLGTQDPSVRAFPGLYITTTAANQIVQYSLGGEIEVDCQATVLLGGEFATGQVDLFVYAYDYIAGSTILTNTTGNTIYQQSYSLPYMYYTTINYVFTQTFAFPGVVYQFASPGTYVITAALGIQTLNGTIKYNRLALSALTGSGTVLKNQ